jgi:hypothetical protein
LLAEKRIEQAPVLEVIRGMRHPQTKNWSPESQLNVRTATLASSKPAGVRMIRVPQICAGVLSGSTYRIHFVAHADLGPVKHRYFCQKRLQPSRGEMPLNCLRNRGKELQSRWGYGS